MQLLRGYKYRLQPTKEQAIRLRQWIGTCRFLYNAALEQRKWAFEQGEKVYYKHQSAELPQLKKEIPWVKEVPSQSLQQTLRDLDDAFKKFFKGQNDFPKTKKKIRTSGLRFPVAPKILDKPSKHKGYVKLPKLGEIKYRKSRDIPEGAEIRSATVSMTPSGDFYISFLVREEIPDPVAPNGEVGIDRGCIRSLALSNGTFFDLPESIKKTEKKIEEFQRKLSFKKRLSKNWIKLKRKLARLHSKVASIRRDFLQKSATTIAKNHGLVVLEKLQIGNMSRSAKGDLENPGKRVAQKSGLNRSILRQGWYMFETMLSQKCSEFGGWLQTVDPKNTSRECFKCGHVSAANRPDQATFKCEGCGHTDNADINAAKIILARGTRESLNALCEHPI